jgi:MtrB/PioB family decaheme-associated outer membrane protein
MNTYEHQFGFKKTLLVVALLAVFGPARAEDQVLAKLISPDSTTVSVGAGGVLGDQEDRTIFGQYNGWSDHSAGLLLDFELIQRNDATGTWMRAQGRDLGLDSRELSFSRDKQGDWKYSAQYSEQVRHDPRSINTGLQGIGSTALTVNTLATPGSGISQNLNTKRRSYTLGFEKWINPNVMLEASLKSEKKDGTQLSGLGAYCSNVITGDRCASTMGALLMMPEPISATTHQLDLKANFSGKSFGLTAGYYGSVYSNDLGSVRFNPISGRLVDLASNDVTPGSGANTLGNLLSQPVALTPNNQAYQVYLTGNYTVTPTIRTNFNYSYTHASQNQSFSGAGLTVPSGLPDNLAAVVDTTLLQVGATARPLPKLSLLANVRYEDISDKTPQALYAGVYSNAPNSSERVASKAEASYQLPQNVRATFGADYSWVKRELPSVGSAVLIIPSTSLTSVREIVDELTYRAELRKSMSETINASIAYSQSNRLGSHWMNLGSTSTRYPSTYMEMRDGDVYAVTGVFPSYMMDRDRDKFRVMVDWTPSDKLSLQLALEDGKDTYTAPTTKGLHSSDMRSVGIDAAYTLSTNWKLTGFINFGEQGLLVDHSGGYIADVNNTSTNFGAGVAGKVNGQLQVGGDLSYLNDRTQYGLGSGNTQAAGVLPDVTYKSLALKLFGIYALNSNTDIRVDLVHQKVTFNEWTWANAGSLFAYSDNSTVFMQPSQNITYLGVKYVYKFK